MERKAAEKERKKAPGAEEHGILRIYHLHRLITVAIVGSDPAPGGRAGLLV